MRKILSILAITLITACTQSTLKNESNVEVDEAKAKIKRLAKTIKNSGNLQTALQLESQLISLDKNDASSYVNLSKSLREAKQNDAALNLLFNGEEVNPESQEIRLELAKTLIANNQPDAALTKLEKVTSIRTVEYFNSKGVAFDMTEDYVSAQESYREGLQKHQRNGTLLNNLALSYMLNGNPKKAIPILEELVKRPKVKNKYRHNLALAYGLNKQDKKAYNTLLKELSAEEAAENLEYYKDFR